MRRGLAGLGESLAERSSPRVERSLTFQTRQCGDPEGFVRTFGVLLDETEGARSLTVHELGGTSEPAPPPECVHGKIVVLSPGERGGEIVCYQRAEAGAEPAVVACCNGTAAAIARHAAAVGRRDVTLRLTLPGGHAVDASARIQPAVQALAVQQTWHRVPFSVLCEDEIDGRRCAVSIGALNHYLVVRTRPGEAPAQVPVAERRRLVRRFGLDCEPLLTRIAVVACDDASTARVEVFTCGERVHPSAPPTGLALLVLAASQLTWLPLRGGDLVSTPAGPMQLPHAHRHADGSATLRFASLIVQLERSRAPVLVAG